MKRLVLFSAPVFISVGVVGCALDPGSETVGETQDEILNGTTVTTDTWGSPTYDGCSSTVLRDRWVLTAWHCGPVAGQSISLLNGATAQLTNPIYIHPTLDVVIARTTASLIPSGSATTRGPFPLYRGSPAKLLNQTVYCQGWGNNACPPSGCTGFGTLRSANLLIDQVNTPTDHCQQPPFVGGPECYRLTMNASGQLQAPGDSGGGCLLLPANIQKRKVTGVMSTWVAGEPKVWQLSAPYFRDWANGIIGSAPTLGALTGFERADLVSSVAYVNSSSHIIELSLGSGTWQRFDLTSILAAPNSASSTAALVRSDGYSSIVYRSSNNHINELAFQHGGGWSKGDLSAITGAAAAAGDPAAYGRSDGVTAVVYRGTDGRVRELSLSAGTWAVGDLLTITGAPVASSDPVGYVRADGTNAVVYRSNDSHVRELTFPFGGPWAAWDLTTAAGAPNAIGKPRPYTRSDGVSAVLYRSSDSHIRELAFVSGVWVHGDVTAMAGAPVATSDFFGYVRSDGVSVVVFRSSDNRIRELSLSGSTWTHSDLTSASGGPLASGIGLSAYVRADRVNSIIYRTSDSHVHELSLPMGSTTWGHGDLTVLSGGAI